MKTKYTIQYTSALVSEMEEFISHNQLPTEIDTPEDWELVMVFKEDHNKYTLGYSAPTGKEEIKVEAIDVLDAVAKSKKVSFCWVPEVLPSNEGNLIYLKPEFSRGLRKLNTVTNIVAYSFVTKGIKDFLEIIDYRRNFDYCDGKDYGTKEEVEAFRSHFLNLFKTEFSDQNNL